MLAITPFIKHDSLPEDIQDSITKVLVLSAALDKAIPEGARPTLMALLQMSNSYYSNKIEGNKTLPSTLLNADNTTPADPARRDALGEILKHIEVQLHVGQNASDTEVVSSGYLKRLHKQFYQGLPKRFMTVHDDQTGEDFPIIPGCFRERAVIVGAHVPPKHDQLAGYMNWFEKSYRLDWIHGANKLVAAAAAHHRLAWIHPFLDGNGRVIRMFTDSYMRKTGVKGYGIWTMSRGFAVRKDAQGKSLYHAHLARADIPRQGGGDGRGKLSDGGLIEFTRFFMETALDQIDFLSDMLSLEGLEKRLEGYCTLRDMGLAARGKEMDTPLRKGAFAVLRAAMHKPILRTDVPAITGTSERTSRDIVKELIEEGFLKGEPKKPLVFQIPGKAISLLFPNLFQA
jgi:Fic family protein